MVGTTLTVIVSRQTLSIHVLMPWKQCVMYGPSNSTVVQKIQWDMFSMEINMVMIIKKPLAEMVCPYTLTLCNFHIRSVWVCLLVCKCVWDAQWESVCVCVCVCERESEWERECERERDTLAQLHIWMVLCEKEDELSQADIACQ